MSTGQPPPVADSGATASLAERIFLSAIVVALLFVAAAIAGMMGGSASPGRVVPTSEIRVIGGDSIRDDPLQAAGALFGSGSRKGYSASKQPEGSFWIGLAIDGWEKSQAQKVVELRMLRASEAMFWKVEPGLQRPVPIRASNVKGGLAVYLDLRAGERVEIVGRISPIGVARPKVFLWEERAFAESEMVFHRWGGVLVGSFIILAMFSALVGLINKDWSFFLFSGWLITSLRVASINDGWDLYWLGISIDNESLLILLRVTLAAHGLLTTALFRSLLASELVDSPFRRWLQLLIYVFCGIVLSAVFVPHSAFLPILWSTAAVGILLLLASLGSVVYKSRSSVSIWYAGSWGITFAGTLVEVGYASGLIGSPMPGLNSQTASVASALVTAIALAEKLRVERHARLAAQREKFELLERFRENYNSMPVGLFSMDRTGIVTLFNPAFAKMFGLPDAPDDANVPMHTLVGAAAVQLLDIGSSANPSAEVELQVRGVDPSTRWFLARVTSKGASIEGSIQDITIRKEAESQLKHLVDHDSLTGLLNRRGLEMTLESAAKAASEGISCAVAHVDMDRFKLINDLYGHAIGDGMLQAAATRLTNAIRAGDRIARMADSFIIILMDCPDHAMTRLTERLRETVGDHPFDLEGKSLSMTVSIGVVPLDPSMGIVDTLTAADRACAEAKARGRNCVVRLSEKDAELKMHLDELKVVAGLRQRVPTERYFLEFQPIVSLRAAKQSLNYEVLIRMRAEDGTVSPPGQFIGAAERNGLMSQIDRWVLRSTLEWLDQHPEHRERLTFATINISGASLNDARFVDDAFSMIAEHPLAMTKLCFEITESIALHDLGSTRRFVDRVRAYGSKLALDDFGAGYTSFSYLKEIPADYIKVDGSFVRDIHRNPANYAITRTIVDLTHELGMRCIAEWAETPETIAALMELRVDYGQGFALARPLAKELVTAAQSSASLVRDPRVLELLEQEPNPQLIPFRPGSSRRH